MSRSLCTRWSPLFANFHRVLASPRCCALFNVGLGPFMQEQLSSTSAFFFFTSLLRLSPPREDPFFHAGGILFPLPPDHVVKKKGVLLLSLIRLSRQDWPPRLSLCPEGYLYPLKTSTRYPALPSCRKIGDPSICQGPAF